MTYFTQCPAIILIWRHIHNPEIKKKILKFLIETYAVVQKQK